MRQASAFYLEFGDVVSVVNTHDEGVKFTLIGQHHLDVCGTIHHMRIGDDKALRIIDYAGSNALHLTLHGDGAEEIKEAKAKGATSADHFRLDHVNAYDSGFYGFHSGGDGIAARGDIRLVDRCRSAKTLFLVDEHHGDACIDDYHNDKEP